MALADHIRAFQTVMGCTSYGFPSATALRSVLESVRSLFRTALPAVCQMPYPPSRRRSPAAQNVSQGNIA